VKLINTIVAIGVALLIVLFAVSNRAPAVVEIWPFPYQLALPLYAVILLTALVGFIAGLVASWLAGAAKRREMRRLRRQVKDLEESLARHQVNTIEK
jgi:putative membrane protein